jgi:hypothetical protein
MHITEITLKNVSNLDKETIISLVKIIRQENSKLPLSDVNDKIMHGEPISVDNKSYLPDELLDILQEYNVDTIIKCDEQNLSIQEYLEKMDEDDEFDDDELDYKSNLLRSLIIKIANHITKNVSDDKLTEKKDDYAKGQLLAYNKIIELLEEEASELGIDFTVLEALNNIIKKNISSIS